MLDPVTVVVVDDEPALVELVSRYLQRAGYTVHSAADGHTALEVIARTDPDVIVLDLMLPGIDGLEVARLVRERTDGNDPYVVMLTARTDEVDRIVGLRVGADDYMTKPFSPGELVARIQAMLRRPRRATTPGRRTFGELTIDAPSRTVTVADRTVELTRTEFDLLDVLSADPRIVHTHDQLMERVWGSAEHRDGHAVAVHIANLRRKLGETAGAQRYVLTVRGVGYRMVAS